METYHSCRLLWALGSRLLPCSGSNFAEQTLSRYSLQQGGTPAFFADQRRSRSRSIYWRLVRAGEREQYFRARAARVHARGLLGNTGFMTKWYFFALMAWIGLSHSLPLSFSYIGQKLQNPW